MDPVDIIQKREDENGIRLSFNLWPTNRIDAVSASCPIGALYTPLKKLTPIGKIQRTPLEYEPVLCPNCRGALNCYAQIDFNSKTWVCPLCKTRCPLPSQYSNITKELLPLELHSEVNTVEYLVNQGTVKPPIFVFVVDICSNEKELENLKSVLLQAIAILPENSLVGFITFGSSVKIHELVEIPYPRSYIFSGNKTYNAQELATMLGIQRLANGEVQTTIIVPAKQAEDMLNNLVDRLEVDKLPIPKDERMQRCTGAALSIAVTLLEAVCPLIGGQIFLFTSGPITKGPGTMATLKRGEPVRQHSDIEKGKADLTRASQQFFSEIGKNASTKNIVINYLSACFEEAGLYELEPAILITGGWLISAESWGDVNISQSIVKYFTSILENAGAEVQTQIICSNNFKISGCIGPCSPKETPGPAVSEKQIGIGGTTSWSLGGALPSTTLAFYFDITASKADPVPVGTTAFIQFVTTYRNVLSGQYVRRVTTTAVNFGDMNDRSSFARSFDQECGTILLAKLAMWKCRTEDNLDVIHFIDKTLIRFCRWFGTYNQGDPSSFTFGESFTFFPQFLYHLRRSPFMSTFNSSPDLTASLRHSLLMEDTTNSLFMIQPTLMQYTADFQQSPVFLDMNSLKKDTILLLDTFFRVLVWYGENVASWRNQGLDKNPDYENVKWMLETPLQEAKALISERFPTPLLITCDQDSSLSRYLLARCNPSENNYNGLGGSTNSLSTEEPSLSKFLQKLKDVAVND
ncbi:Sec23/Sec24 trunk domain containing protein [Trichomonas vaginalis G3]|uniref:Protein transport protein SEC23 n=1 Tax=Trichomonas vaginalis (strain ATCC PRA-98 / G3) TaxID=412133 RepID=A2FIA9_TRIV3|nr:COPII-coated vesicle budding [Trichomonas vaginalis G3]EAX95350.1 Sec23/Sec24 trunk domain containing protein [Trichomonas vaginalis G3]KAI5521013.1 COPII-coated vesicle budding [Trichomonas vaginalis G3]|eukprot:XP_001308280.1 Sec23/Sec24 trunk domain containing protein [Trichomonas vaginalis G3]